jgi:hypothetical protein
MTGLETFFLQRVREREDDEAERVKREGREREEGECESKCRKGRVGPCECRKLV